MSYVPSGGGGSVSSTSGSGIVVSGGSVLSSGLVAGSNITLTPDSSFGGKGLRIDSSGGGGGGLASVTSSNGSGINVSQVGPNANLTSALAAGTGIALTPSGVSKTLTINNTQTVASAGNGSGINATVVGNQTNISTNLVAGAGVAISPSGLNSSINISSPAAASAVQSITAGSNIATTSGTAPTVSLVSDVVLPVNGSLSINRNAGALSSNDGLEVWNAAGNGYFYVSEVDGSIGHWNITGGLPGYSDWFIQPNGNSILSTLTCNTSITSQGTCTIRNIVNSIPPAGFGDILLLKDSANSYYIQYNDGGSLGGWNVSPNTPVWSINNTGTLSTTGSVIGSSISTSGSVSAASATVTGQTTTGSLNFPLGQITLSSGSGTNRVQAATPAGNETLAYLTDLPQPQTLQEVCALGNAVSAPGIQFLPPTTTPGVFAKCFNTEVLTLKSTNFGNPATLLMDDGGTVSLGTLNFQTGALSLSSSPSSGRITVSGSGPSQTLAYLSDITTVGGVQSVSAGNGISVSGTTNPTVSLAANPNITGSLTQSGSSPNYFNAGVYTPGVVVNNNFTGSGNPGVAITTPSSNVAQMISQDGTTPCQLRVIGTQQISSLLSGGSTATLSSSNGNLNINNVRALVQTTGANYLGISNLTLPGGSTYALTAANFGQTLVIKFATSGTLTITLPNISSGTVPLGSFINICNQLNDSVTGTTIVVSQTIGNPATNATFTNKNQMMTFILTGYSSTTPMYHCIGQ